VSRKTTILVVEDEDPLRMALCDALRGEGFDVIEAEDGEQGLYLATREAPDVVLLDLMLPKLDGFAVLRAIREDRVNAAVIILSARGEEWDRVHGFEYGADDYVVKPFSTRELVLRIRAVLKRAAGDAPGVEQVSGKVRLGNAFVDFAGYCVERNGAREGLSRRELELLRYFMANPGRVLERSKILDDVWGKDEFPTTRTVDMHVLKLRKKIEDDPEAPRLIQTVHGVGYRFEPRG
jgi:two-component system alkaline phosphatase synthesis response regulator PhoP